MGGKLGFCSAATAFSTVAFLLIGADTAGVNYVESEKVAAALAKGGSLVRTPEFTVSGSHRDKGGQVEMHEKENDILYVVEGETGFNQPLQRFISIGGDDNFLDPLLC